MACTICFVWCDEAPCIGRSETISYFPLPTGAAQVDEFTGVAPPPPPPPLPPPLLPPLLLLPQPAATASRSATAATITARPGTLLMKSPPTADDRPTSGGNRRGRETVYLPSRADGSKRAAHVSDRCLGALASPRNGTPRGGRRHGLRLRIRIRRFGIQSGDRNRVLEDVGRRVAEVDGQGGDAGVVPGLDAEPDRRDHPRPVEHRRGRAAPVAARLRLARAGPARARDLRGLPGRDVPADLR